MFAHLQQLSKRCQVWWHTVVVSPWQRRFLQPIAPKLIQQKNRHRLLLRAPAAIMCSGQDQPSAPLYKYQKEHATHICDRNSSRNWCQLWWHLPSPKIQGGVMHLITSNSGVSSCTCSRQARRRSISASRSSYILTTKPGQLLLSSWHAAPDQLISFDLISDGHDFYREFVQISLLVSRISI